MLVHGTSVVIQNRAVLITGASGSGKSSLAVQLIGLGAKLIADDQTALSLRDDTVWTSRPKTLPPVIEARGVGLLNAPIANDGPLSLVIDMDTMEKDRLPPNRSVCYLGQTITMLRKVDAEYFPFAIFVYVSHMHLAESPLRR